MLYAPERYEVLFPCVYVGDRFDERVAALTNGERVFGVWGTGFWFRKNG
jgi:hypothetical protein